MKQAFYLFALIVVFSSFNTLYNNKVAQADMPRVTGVGGVFFKAENPKALREWYKNTLGFNCDEYGTSFVSRYEDNPSNRAFTLWAPFKSDTKYFLPSQKSYMLNFRVTHIEELYDILYDNEVLITDTIENTAYGKFFHFIDIEANKVELWEPNDSMYNKYTGKAQMW
jgi:hypothetical protein